MIYGMQWCASNDPVFLLERCLGICDALLCVSHTLRSALESGWEPSIVQIDFSAAFDRVNHRGILYRLCSVGIGKKEEVKKKNCLFKLKTFDITMSTYKS